MIHTIAQQFDIEIPQSMILNLGYRNGWDTPTYKFMEELRPYRIPDGSSSKTLSNCLYEYASTYRDSITNEILTIVYREDSGD